MQAFMKYFLLPLLFVAIQFSVQAQTEEEFKSQADSTLIIDGDTLPYYYNDFQPYVSGLFEISNSPDNYLESLSVEGGFIWKNRLIVGAFATAFQASVTQKVIFPNDYELFYNHGGFLIGYRTDKKGIFDFRLVQKVSFGEMAWKNIETDKFFLSDRFVILNPTVGIDVNLSRYVKLAGSLGYRKILDLSLAQISQQDFDGITFRLGLSLGLFNFVER